MGELLSSQPLLVAVLVLLVMFLFLGMGIWVFAALTLVSLTGLVVFLDMPIDRLGVIVKGTMWRTANTWELAAIPIFVWMGELIFRTDVSERLFRGLEPWVDLIPGRLFHTNIAGCTLFAAVSGSSQRPQPSAVLRLPRSRNVATTSGCRLARWRVQAVWV